MPDSKISELTSAGTLTGTELIPVVQSGATVKTTFTAVQDTVVAAVEAHAFTAAGTTAARTLANQLSDTLSVKQFNAVGDGVTSDQTAIATAVAAALAVSATLYWPAGTYVITGSVTNFHIVRHSGPGRVKLGSDIFSITPTATQTNTIYVSASGSNANIGLAASHPMLTIQRAIQILRDFGPYLGGTWIISVAAGSYATAGFTSGLRSLNAIVIQGPTQPGWQDVPTVEITKALSGTATVGLYGGPYLRLTVKNIKVSGYNALDESGFEFARFCTLIFENCHADSCHHGIHVLDFTNYAIKGGIISNCFYGVFELFGIVRDFKYASGAGSGTYINNCGVGIKSKELCTGHVDYSVITDNTYGIEFSRCCTGNLTNATIQRNYIGIVCVAGSAFVDLTTDWGVGTVNKNTIKFLTLGGSSELGRQGGENILTAPFKGFVERKVAFSYTSTPHTGTLTKTYVVTPGYTTIAGDFQAKGSHIRMIIWGSTAANAATSTLGMEISTSTAANVTLPAAAVNFFAEFYISVTADGDTQHSWGRVTTSAAASPNLMSAVSRTYAFSTTALAVRVGVTLGNIADTVTIVGAEIYTTDA